MSIMPTSKSHPAIVLLASACLAAGSAHSEDIDLFVGAQASSTELPNVLFVIDNTANWTQAFTSEKTALQNVFNNLKTKSNVNIGVMFSAETSNADNSVQGGYVRAAVRTMNEVNAPKYADMFAALDVGKDKGNSGQSSLVMSEAFYYFLGKAPYSGNGKAKTDYLGNTGADWSNSATTAASKAAMQQIYLLSGNALSSKHSTKYNAPPSGSGCAKKYIIYVSNGPSQDSASIISKSTSLLAQEGGNTTAIKLAVAGSQDNVTDEWARFLHDQHDVVIHSIEINPATTGQGPGWTELIRRMAEDNDGSYKAVTGSTTDIETAINDTLAQIQATNSVFASVSLPLSASAQGTYLNQVYVGLFRPDGTALPRWDGNLKQYKLGYTGTTLRTQDVAGDAAVDATSGFVKVCAKSFWTSANTYWNFRAEQFEDQSGCAVADASKPPAGSDYPDGKFVEKGGQAQLLRATKDAARSLKTCTGFTCSSVVDFDKSNVTAAMLGVTSATEQEHLINWARGQDVDNEHTGDGIDPTNSGVTSKAMRPSVHGDVVHSRPVAVNFGSESSPKVVVFYGGNDGVFRAINGNRPENGTIDSVAPGGELWGFVPPEFHKQFDRLHDNDVQISFPNVTVGNPLPKPYGIDGAITSYREGSDAWIFAAMRRGGRAVYAFDVNESQPSQISLKWKIGCDDSQCTNADWSALGQTWSPPKSFKARGVDSGTSPLLIMGGGYDTCEDALPNTCNSTSRGRNVYVLEARTGKLLKSFATDRSVVAEVAVVPDQSTGLGLYAYVADLGGNVYRITMGEEAVANWTMTKIAALGCATASSTCNYNRKFMFAPDVLLQNGTYMLLLGSGDREKPREYTSTTSNYFFMLRDRPSDPSWLSTEVGNCGTGVLCLDSLLPIAGDETPSADALGGKKGWYLALNPTEQVVTAAITIYGVVTFSTHEPERASPGMCSANLGLARVYNISYLDASSENGTEDRSEELPPDIGLPPSPVAGLVTLDNGQTVPFCIGCSADSPLEGSEPQVPASVSPAQPKSRVYWYIER